MSLFALSMTLLAVVTLSLSGCGGSPTAPVDHRPPTDGTRFMYERHREYVTRGFDTTLIHELHLEIEEEWNGYEDVYRFLEEDPPDGDNVLMYYANLRYLENGDLRYLSDQLEDTIYAYDYPFGGGSDTVRTIVETDHEAAWHAATYEGEESIEVDGTTYTARVVKDYLVAGGDGHSGGAFIMDVTAFYVPELGVVPRLRVEMWTPDDMGAREKLLVIDTFTLLRIEE